MTFSDLVSLQTTRSDSLDHSCGFLTANSCSFTYYSVKNAKIIVSKFLLQNYISTVDLSLF